MPVLPSQVVKAHLHSVGKINLRLSFSRAAIAQAGMREGSVSSVAQQGQHCALRLTASLKEAIATAESFFAAHTEIEGGGRQQLLKKMRADLAFIEPFTLKGSSPEMDDSWPTPAQLQGITNNLRGFLGELEAAQVGAMELHACRRRHRVSVKNGSSLFTPMLDKLPTCTDADPRLVCERRLGLRALPFHAPKLCQLCRPRGSGHLALVVSSGQQIAASG